MFTPLFRDRRTNGLRDRRAGRTSGFRRFGAVVTALVLPVAVACGGGSESGGGDEVLIGVLDPLSGANATTGTDALRGAQLAAQIINGGNSGLTLPLAGGGLPRFDRKKIRLLQADSKGDPQTGASEAERLVNDRKVVALTGAYQSAVTKTASERAERLRVPFVNGDSSSTSLTARGLKYFFRTGPTDLVFGQEFFALLAKQRSAGTKVETIGILHTNDQFGTDGAGVTTRLAQQNGFRIGPNVGYDVTATDLTPQVQRVRQGRPDALFVLSFIKDTLLLGKTLKQLGYTPPAVVGYGAGFSDPALVQGPENQANATGFLRRSAWALEVAQRNPTAAKVAAMFQQRYNAPMTENSARAFTAVMTLAQAIDQARSTDPERIRSALKAITVPSAQLIVPWGDLKFGADQQNAGARGVVEQFADGRWHVVYPDDVRSRAVQWPIRR